MTGFDGRPLDLSPVAVGEPIGPLGADLAGASLSLARALAAGATLWCWSPPWPDHARHVAVEFVHPVIMGKRALPAEAVSGPDPVGALRALVAPGDVVLAIAPGDDAEVVEVMRRAPAWGIETVWLALGARPPAGAAGHVLWLEDGDGSAAHTGELVLLYHVLWELTHVCFEHPGLLAASPSCDGGTCVTCADEGRLGEVVQAGPEDRATVRTAAGHEEVDTTLLGSVQANDLVLIHAGMAIDRVGGP